MADAKNRREGNSNVAEIILWSQIAATLYMVGLIWFVQVVHYPLFGSVGEEQFGAYEVAHQNRTTIVVGPPMLLEMFTAIALIFIRPAGVPTTAVWIGLGLLVIVWASTFFLQVPMHEKLSGEFQSDAHSFLVNSNWIRTIGWTAKGAIVIWMGIAAQQLPSNS